MIGNGVLIVENKREEKKRYFAKSFLFSPGCSPKTLEVKNR